MRITCPSCQATYDVPEALLAPTQTRAPARLRCARCATEWAPAELAKPEPAKPQPAKPEPAKPIGPTPSPFADALAQAVPARPAAPPPAAPLPQAPLPEDDQAVPPAFPRAPERITGENRAASRLPPRPAAPAATPRDTVTVLFAWCLSLGVVAALLIAAYVHQAEVVAFWPPAARAYALLGLK